MSHSSEIMCISGYVKKILICIRYMDVYHAPLLCRWTKAINKTAVHMPWNVHRSKQINVSNGKKFRQWWLLRLLYEQVVDNECKFKTKR